MADFPHQLIKVCSRTGMEYYHVVPEHAIGYFPGDFKDLKIKISNPKFCVISFPDCDVTVFPSGRMLIENLSIGSDERARTIVKEIVARWL